MKVQVQKDKQHLLKAFLEHEFSELTGGPLPGDDKYVLEQFHCHWGAVDNEGSEHTVCGRRFSGEVNNRKILFTFFK